MWRHQVTNFSMSRDTNQHKIYWSLIQPYSLKEGVNYIFIFPLLTLKFPSTFFPPSNKFYPQFNKGIYYYYYRIIFRDVIIPDDEEEMRGGSDQCRSRWGMKRPAQVRPNSNSGGVAERVADAMPNNKTETPAPCRHAFLFPSANVLRRSKVLRNRPTKLKRIMILNFHFVPILEYVSGNLNGKYVMGIFLANFSNLHHLLGNSIMLY